MVPKVLEVSPAEPAELVSALPALLGFYPQDALVIANVRAGKLTRISHHDIAATDLVACCLDCMRQSPPADFVFLVIVSGGFHDEHRNIDDPVPYASAALSVRDALRAAGAVIRDILWTSAIMEDEFWQSVTNWRRHGLLPDAVLKFSPTFAAEVGCAVYPARPSAADEPIAHEEDRYRASLIYRAERTPGRLDRGEHLRVIGRALTDARNGRLPAADHEIGLLVEAIAGPAIQDVILAATIRHQLLAAARSLWLLLTRLTLPPLQSWPAALLGATAYIRGEHALARTALHIAAASHEDLHDMAFSLLRFMARGGSMSERDWLDWLTEDRPFEDQSNGRLLDAALKGVF